MVLRTLDVELLIDDDHSARSIWELVGLLDLSLYYAQIASVQGRAGREHTDPQLLISLWLYAYSRGISSAREIARQCEYEPAFPALDAAAPYPFAHGGVFGDTPAANLGTPGSGAWLAPWTLVQVNVSLTAQLLWTPQAANGTPVPLQNVGWQWTGVASWSAGAWSVLGADSNALSTGVANWPAYPTWGPTVPNPPTYNCVAL